MREVFVRVAKFFYLLFAFRSFFLNMQYYFAEQGYFGGRERLDLLQI